MDCQFISIYGKLCQFISIHGKYMANSWRHKPPAIRARILDNGRNIFCANFKILISKNDLVIRFFLQKSDLFNFWVTSKNHIIANIYLLIGWKALSRPQQRASKMFIITSIYNYKSYVRKYITIFNLLYFLFCILFLFFIPENLKISLHKHTN